MTEIWALNGVLKLPFAPPLYHRIGMASSPPDINKVGIDIKRIPVCFDSRQSLAPSRCLFMLSSHLSIYLFFKERWEGQPLVSGNCGQVPFCVIPLNFSFLASNLFPVKICFLLGGGQQTCLSCFQFGAVVLPQFLSPRQFLTLVAC